MSGLPVVVAVLLCGAAIAWATGGAVLYHAWRTAPYEPPRLIDWSGLTGENRLECTCGERIWPDCDVSAASIDAEFEAHLAAAHAWEEKP